MNKLRAAFSKYPREGHSPQDAAIKFQLQHFLEVRGNVFERLNGTLDESVRNSYLQAASTVANAHKKLDGDISCILRELKKL